MVANNLVRIARSGKYVVGPNAPVIVSVVCFILRYITSGMFVCEEISF